jgi:hypothetical protein
METNIIYKYRAPDAPPGSESTITAKSQDLDPNEVLTGIHQIGETITIDADVSKGYVVVARHPVLTQLGDHGFTASVLFVVVTDPVS